MDSFNPDDVERSLAEPLAERIGETFAELKQGVTLRYGGSKNLGRHAHEGSLRSGSVLIELRARTRDARLAPAANPGGIRLSARTPHSVLSAALKRNVCVTSSALIRNIYVFALIKSLTGIEV